MKLNLLFAIAFIVMSTGAFAEDIPNGTQVGMTYRKVRVIDVESASITSKLISTGTTVVHYEGTLTVKLKVEGNICNNSVSTLGAIHTFNDEDSSTLHFIVGHKGPETKAPCTHHSVPATVYFHQPVSIIKPTDKALLVSYVVPTNEITGDKTVMIKEAASGDRLVVSVE